MNRASPFRRGLVTAGTSLISLASLGLLGSSCGAGDECQIGQSRCQGNTLGICSGPPCAEPSCPGNQWHNVDCGPETTCVTSKLLGAECVLSPVPDPLCHDSAYCAGDEIVFCFGEYASARRYDCSAGCGGRPCVSTIHPAIDGGVEQGGAECSGDSSCFSRVDYGVECQAPRACGALVTWQQMFGPPPTAHGGTIVACHYTLTQAGFYAGSAFSTAPFRRSLDISATMIASADADQVGSGLARSGPYTVSGETLNWNVTCPPNLQNVEGVTTYSYNATPTQLTLYDAAAQLLLVYERAP